MYVKNLEINKIRCFPNRVGFEFSRNINILVGSTNSGKSTVLRSILSLQENNSLTSADITRGETKGHIIITLADIDSNFVPFGQQKAFEEFKDHDQLVLLEFAGEVGSNSAPTATLTTGNRRQGLNYVEIREPRNFIIPLFAKYRSSLREEAVNSRNSGIVSSSNLNITSKVDQLLSKGGPKREVFINLCKDILGIEISSNGTPNGKDLGYFSPNDEWIPILSMGDGVSAYVWFLYYLVTSSGKLFLLEEPENSIHPKALKALLPHIVESSERNQFVIATHSAIVTNMLGANNTAKVFSLNGEMKNGLHTCSYEVCENSTDRQKVLEELGFELSDLGLWEGWLLLEESTMERFIREYLIPNFTPGLSSKLGTVSSNGAEQLENRFIALNSLFLFIHREVTYKNRAWVIADGDPVGIAAIDKLKERFKSWPSNHFKHLSLNNLESYYPSDFKNKVDIVLAMPHGQEKMARKSELLKDVLDWAGVDPTRRKTIEESADELINHLKDIEKQLS